MAAIDKAARLEEERQQAKEQVALKVQQLDPPFPFKVVPFNEKLLVRSNEVALIIEI